MTTKSKRQLKVDIIENVLAGKMSILDAQKFLGNSVSSIYRYIKEYEKLGVQFAIHKNTGRQPSNKTASEIREQVQILIKEKYYDLNLTHLREKLEANDGICINRETLRKWAHEKNMVKRAKKGKAKPKKRRERMLSPGLLLQMDGSSEIWFGRNKSCLMAIIDDANSEVHAEFFESETSLACMALLKEVILHKGIFKAIYVDRAGLYGGSKRVDFSQVKRACEELDIHIIFANSPEGKGRIERLFNTFQDRLIPELRLEGINEMTSANKYLKEVFLPHYWNKRCTVESICANSEYKPLNPQINIDEILVCKEYRQVKRDHTFSLFSQLYVIESEIRSSIYKQKIEIRLYSKKHFKAFFAGRELKVSKVTEQKRKPIEKNRSNSIKENEMIKQVGKVEGQIINLSISNPHWTQRQVRQHFRKVFNIDISKSDLLGIWLRNGLTSTLERTHAKNQHLCWKEVRLPKMEISTSSRGTDV